MCTYIHAMQNDLEITIMKHDYDSSLLEQKANEKFYSKKSKSWLFAIDAIDFHNDIVE